MALTHAPFLSTSPSQCLVIGLSTDEKPDRPGMFIETDTGQIWVREGTEWVCASDKSYEKAKTDK